jgi:ABC-type antimicrobial peptide transport system permease subunit
MKAGWPACPGSTRAEILWLVLHQSLIVISAGIIAGLFLSLITARIASSMLFGLSLHDPLTLLGSGHATSSSFGRLGFNPRLESFPGEPN